MSFRDCLVVERANDWFIVVGTEVETVSRDVPTEELVTCVGLMIKLAGLKQPRCVLAPSSSSCFFVTLPTGPELDGRDRSALTYELEDHVPLDAESMAADFVPLSPAVTKGILTHRSQDLPGGDATNDDTETVGASWVAAVAVEVASWHAIAEAFELSGIEVRSIVPSSILAARSLSQTLSFTDTVEVLLIEKDRGDLLTLRGESILTWKHVQLDRETLRRHKILDAPPSDSTVIVGGENEQLALIRDVLGEADTSEESIETHWLQGAELYLSKQSSRWFDLRRDQLGPSDPLRPIVKQVRLVAVAAAACLIAMALGGWWRTKRIDAEIQRIRSEQQELFRESFPGTRVPAALLRRVKIEHTRVMGSRGASSQVDVPKSAPRVLQELLRALPDDVRFRITNIKVLNGEVDLDLQVRSPVDAGAFATSLSESGFEVEPPVITQKDAKTFDALLEAKWNGPADGDTTEQSDSARDVTLRISTDREFSSTQRAVISTYREVQG